MSDHQKNESCLIVLNPKAGAGKAGMIQTQIKEMAQNAFKQVDLVCTEGQGHATVIASEACEKDYDVIAAVGGDGTCHEVMNGMIHNDRPKSPKTVFSLIPMGTGSDLQKTIGAPKTLKEAIHFAANGETKLCDIGKCAASGEDGKTKTRYFINAAGFGANGDAARRSNKSSKKLGGTITFLSAAIVTAIKYKPVPVKIEWIDNDHTNSWEETLISCFIANGSYCGGGMWIGPKATMYDNQLDFTLVPHLGIHKQLMAIPRLYNGTVGEFPGITTCKGQSLRATPEQNKEVPIELDGELFGSLPANFSILPRILKIRSKWG